MQQTSRQSFTLERSLLHNNEKKNSRSLLYDDFPELLQHVDSPQVSRHWDHPIETTGLMKRLSKLSLAERAKLNRQLNDAMEAWLE
jgi:hypothetical protein